MGRRCVSPIPLSWGVTVLIEHVYDVEMTWLTEAPDADSATYRAAENAGLELAGQLNAVNGALTTYVEVLLATGAWVQGAVTTPSAFLQWKLGLSPARADELVEVAAKRADYPQLVAAFDRGELSLDQVAASMKAPSYADADLAEFARIATVTKIRRFVRSNAHADSAGPPPKDRLSVGTRNGRWRIHGDFDLDTGRTIESALAESRDRQFADGHEAVTWAEALVDVAERSLGAVESPSRRDSYRTWLHMEVGSGDVTTTDGWRIPMEVRNRLLCDGVVQPVWERDGLPFGVGRSQRIVPERTRRIVEFRDRGCRVPGCNADRHVEIHHIIHWLMFGPTETWNLVCLCPRHHKMHHQGRLGINGNADDPFGIVFTDARGSPIDDVGVPVLPTGPPATTDVAYDPPLRDRFDWNWISGWVHPDLRDRRLDDLRNRRAA